MLPKEFRPPEAYAQWAASTVLRDAYFTFAKYTAMISIAMWVIASAVFVDYWSDVGLMTVQAARFPAGGAKRE